MIIIGGGPAGMSAALWCSDLGLRSVLIDREPVLGGQLRSIFNPIKNYLGISVSNGEELLEQFVKSLKEARFELRAGQEVVSAKLVDRMIELADGSKLTGKAIVIATGVRRRKLRVSGEEKFQGKGILASASKEFEMVRGSSVVVVGGGDAALENALILSRYADAVTLVHRRDEFKARGEFVESVMQRPNITILTGHVVTEFEGSESLTSVVVTDLNSGAAKVIPCDYSIIRIGVETNTELLSQQLNFDANGYIVVSPRCLTNIEIVFAVGDVAHPRSLTIATAVGSAATAIKNFGRKR